MARVRDGADDRDVELARDEEVVQLGRGPGHQVGRDADQPPVDGAVDRIAVDVGNAAQSHSAPSTTPATTGSWRLPLPRACARCSMWKVGPWGPSARGLAAVPGIQSSNVR